jgi:hypothetical protein
MPIALTSDQADLAAAVAGFTARHADIAATRAAFEQAAFGLLPGFGAPIGSFQAVKHRCARLYARTELLTAVAWDAAVAGQDGERQFALAAAVAAVLGPPAAVDIALDTITLLGGIGYTWEHDVQLYWRRAMSLAALLGPAGAWRKRLTSLSRATGRHHDLPLVDEPAGLRASVAPVLAEAARIGRPWPAAPFPGHPRPRGPALPARHRRRPGRPGRDRPGVRAGGAGPAVDDRGGVGAACHPRARRPRAAGVLRRRHLAGRHHLVPAVRRAGGRLGPGQLAHPRGAAAAVLTGPSHDLSVPPQLIGGGTAEIQLNVIGEQVLGLPR